MPASWEELGARVAEARKDLRLTQLELAAAVGVERTVITKIESGQRTVDSLELARLANVLRRPISWFITTPSPSVVSRRAERSVMRREDIELETIAQDVEQLIELGVLTPPAAPPATLTSIDDTEAIAASARRAAGLRPDEPIWDIVRVVERLGLYAFVLPMEAQPGPAMDGSYVALARGGVALINGAADVGRRRFTIAHELGHHVLADQYATEWVVGTGTDDREKIVNAFAIHFLLPRAAVEPRWQRLDGAGDPRNAAMHIAVELGTSWSATCAQLHRLGRLTPTQHDAFVRATPTRAELVERELAIRDDAIAPAVPPGYAAAVLRALNRGKVGPNRALELLHGTVLERDLPPAHPLSLDAMTGELASIPE